MLTEGLPFPDFALHDQSGETVTLASLKGKRVVLYFYPKDDTPGCTTEACELNERMPHFAGVEVSRCTVASIWE